MLIRIRILGSIHRITDPDSSLFGSGFQDANKKNFFSLRFFCFFLAVRTLTVVFKDNMSLRSQKIVEIILYLNLFACWMLMEGSGAGSVQIIPDPDHRKRKHTDPTDPEHCWPGKDFSPYRTGPNTFSVYLYWMYTKLVFLPRFNFTLGYIGTPPSK